MRKMDFKSKMMLGCVGLLIVAMLSIGVRYTNSKLLMKRLHIDNALTRAIFWDSIWLTTYGAEPVVAIDWAKKYPFEHEGGKAATSRISLINTKVAEEEKKITDWTTDYFTCYGALVRLGKSYDKLVWFDIGRLKPGDVYEVHDGYYSVASARKDMTERANSVSDFKAFVEENGARFLYVNAPIKVNKYADEAARGIDFSNDNIDEL